MNWYLFFFLRFNTYYHYGPSSKGNSRFLQLPSRQPESIPFLASVYTGRSEVTLVLYTSTCLNLSLCNSSIGPLIMQSLHCQASSSVNEFFLSGYLLHVPQESGKMLYYIA